MAKHLSLEKRLNIQKIKKNYKNLNLVKKEKRMYLQISPSP